MLNNFCLFKIFLWIKHNRLTKKYSMKMIKFRPGTLQIYSGSTVSGRVLPLNSIICPHYFSLLCLIPPPPLSLSFPQWSMHVCHLRAWTEPPVWRVQTLSNAYVCPATEGNAARSVRDQLQLINTNNGLLKKQLKRPLTSPADSVTARCGSRGVLVARRSKMHGVCLNWHWFVVEICYP